MARFKALIIDDEKDIIELLQFFLDDHVDSIGYTDPIEAIKSLKSEVFDIVITDYKMPGMNGIEVLKEVMKEIPSCSLAIMSGAIVNFEEIAPDLFGRVHIIEKPFNSPEILLKTILSILKK